MTPTRARLIRRGIVLARLGDDIDYRNEHPETIDAYMRANAKQEEA